MKKIKWLLIILIIVISISSPVWIWWLMPENSLRILVVDKTVPHTDYREHKVLFWGLNHYKTTPPKLKRPWTLNRDYIGRYPERLTAEGKPVELRLSPSDVTGMDLLFIADTYGVYTLDLIRSQKKLTALDYSRRLYGGMDEEEVGIIEKFVQAGGILVAEFNTFASPTHGKARERLEQMLGVKWTEWSGRYFPDLADVNEVPVWARRHWKIHYQLEWRFKGPGWLFSHEDSRLFVLEDGKDVESKGLKIKIRAANDSLMNGVLNNVPYRFWYDVVTPNKESEVLANYFIHLTPSGKEKMNRFGVPPLFPAVIRASRDPLRLYMAGDFSDNNTPTGPYYIEGLTELKRVGRLAEFNKDQSAFLHEFYLPLLGNILEVAKASKYPAQKSK